MYNLIGNISNLNKYYLAENMRWHKAKTRKKDKISKLARRRNRK